MSTAGERARKRRRQSTWPRGLRLGCLGGLGHLGLNRHGTISIHFPKMRLSDAWALGRPDGSAFSFADHRAFLPVDASRGGLRALTCEGRLEELVRVVRVFIRGSGPRRAFRPRRGFPPAAGGRLIKSSRSWRERTTRNDPSGFVPRRTNARSGHGSERSGPGRTSTRTGADPARPG